MFWTIAERVVPICLMAAVLLLSRMIVQRSHRQRMHAEAQRLRRALSVGLKNLRDLYTGNIESLEHGDRRLLTARNQLGLVRSQLGRLVSLEVTEVEAVMTACFAAETAESAMAMSGRAVAGVSYMVSVQVRQRGALRKALDQACARLGEAERLLEPPASSDSEEPLSGQAMTILTPTTTSMTEIPERTTFSGA